TCMAICTFAEPVKPGGGGHVSAGSQANPALADTVRPMPNCVPILPGRDAVNIPPAGLPSLCPAMVETTACALSPATPPELMLQRALAWSPVTSIDAVTCTDRSNITSVPCSAGLLAFRTIPSATEARAVTAVTGPPAGTSFRVSGSSALKEIERKSTFPELTELNPTSDGKLSSITPA